MILRIASVILLSLLLLSARAPAAVVDGLYEVAVPVDDQTTAERSRGTRAALLEMLSRATGLVDVPRNEVVRGAIAKPGRYFVQYRYEQRVVPEGRALDLVVRFEPGAITRLANAASLPLWGANRPSVLAWLVTDEYGRREILGADSDHPVLAGLRARARQRGIGLRVPLMDLEDQIAVPSAAVYGSVSAVLDEGSRRYAGDTLLIGRVRQEETGSWTVEWEFWMHDSERELAVREADPIVAGGSGADLVADELAARYAVYSGELGVLKLQVGAVKSVAAYGGLVEYLESLEFIESVQVTEVAAERVYIDLVTPTPWLRFVELLELDRRLAPLPAIPGAERHQLTWREALDER